MQQQTRGVKSEEHNDHDHHCTQIDSTEFAVARVQTIKVQIDMTKTDQSPSRSEDVASATPTAPALDSPLREFLENGPFIQAFVLEHLTCNDLLQLRACNSALHKSVTEGFGERFWSRRCEDWAKRTTLQLFRYEEDIDSSTPLGTTTPDFWLFSKSMRLQNRSRSFGYTKKATTFRVDVFARFRPAKQTPTSTTPGPPFLNEKLGMLSPRDLFCTENGHVITLKGILQPGVSAEKAFRLVAGHRVHEFLCGRDGCILMYGQTASGKSHSLFGDLDRLDGIIPLTMLRTLEFLTTTPDLVGSLVISAEEVYRDKSFTLLESRMVENATDVERELRRLCSRRLTRSTAMNAHSSRSHCLVTLKLHQSTGSSELKIVDLAGTERMKRACSDCMDADARRERMSEGIAINKSLSGLSRTLNALATGAKHVPLNDSLLTRRLSRVLGGGSNTQSSLSIVCCCSSDNEDYAETCSTLRFAEQASSIQFLSHSPPSEGVKSLVQLQSTLNAVEIEMSYLQSLWNRALWSNLHDPLCRCDRCQQKLEQGELKPQHMRRWRRLHEERDELLLQIDLSRRMVISIMEDLME